MSEARRTEILENQIDDVTNALTTIEYDHHEVHEGNMYSVSHVQSVDTTSFKWQVTTPNTDKLAHMIFNLECIGELLATITEGSDRTDGTALAEVNHNRASSNTAGVVVTHTPTGGSTDGATTIFAIRSGATGTASKTIAIGARRGVNEFILKKNTKYVIAATTYAASYVSLELSWYEHEDAS